MSKEEILLSKYDIENDPDCSWLSVFLLVDKYFFIGFKLVITILAYVCFHMVCLCLK